MSAFRKEVADTASDFGVETTDTKMDGTNLTLTNSIGMSDLGKPSIPSIQSLSQSDASISTLGHSAEGAAASANGQPATEVEPSQRGYQRRVEQMSMSAQATVG